MVGLRDRRPLPDRQPVLPHVRATRPASSRALMQRRDDHPASRCSTSTTCCARSAEERSRCCPGRRRSTSRSSTTPTATSYDLSSLRLAVTGAADIPVELIRRMRDELPFATIVTGYGLTEAGTVTGHRARRRPRDHRDHRRARAIPGVEVRIVDDDGRRGARRRAGRGRGARLQRDARLPRRSRGDRRGDRRRRLAAHRRHRRRSTSAATCASPTASRTCSSSAASTPTRPRSRTCCSRHPDVAQVAVVGVPDDRLGEVGMAFVVLAPGADARPPTSSSRGAATQMANYKVPRCGRDRRRAAAERDRQGREGELRARAAARVEEAEKA